MEIKKRGRPFGTTKKKVKRHKLWCPEWFRELRKIYSWEKIEELLKKR